jgi:hypothetical protein
MTFQQLEKLNLVQGKHYTFELSGGSTIKAEWRGICFSPMWEDEVSIIIPENEIPMDLIEYDIISVK